MNISTGKPQILLFERDQQFATLLTSELQLAGYECYTARTAVEVFDSIARNSIQLVLVNLAQAAASRREFWVALDTQRRGRGIQVFSFYCANLAGYGPHDLEERSQAIMADMEIDGMPGLVSLIDAIRVRVPSGGGAAPHASIAGNTGNTSPMQRLPKLTTPMPAIPSPSPPPMPQRSAPPTYSTPSSSTQPGNGTSYRSTLPSEGSPVPSTQRSSYISFTPNSANPPMPSVSPIPIRMNVPAFTPQQPMPGNTTTNVSQPSQPSYVEKIRAVLYPNQRAWSSPGNPSKSTMPENRIDPQNSAQQAIPTNQAPVDTPILQRLANGQVESGLAQLSRMVQERNTPNTSMRESINQSMPYHQPETIPFAQPPIAQTFAPNPTINPKPMSSSKVNHAPIAPRPIQPVDNIGSIPMRASPIQDMPAERAIGSEHFRRPDAFSRANYGQQPAPIPPLSSIATPMPTIEPPAAIKQVPEEEETQLHQRVKEPLDDRRKTSQPTLTEQSPADSPNILHQEDVAEERAATHSSLLLDIMQSLPPMPPPSPQPPQAIQPQVLNGRAMRSLGNVLIAGHLVPQSRLEVAENIQRMLCGVDLNYQLGEILLMFKLLTPDQLLAASLVSYGLITTTQISSLGRIRQELHSIGLEYDLENLLILFRILTPEQLREVKSSWQS